MLISKEQIKNELIKSFSDKTHTYMIESYLSTLDLSQEKEVPFKLFPRQKDLLYAYSEYRNNVTTKPRQAGISTVTAAFVACEIALAQADSPQNVLIIANKSDMSQLFLKKIKEFLRQIPRFFWGDEYFNNDKSIFIVDNAKELELPNGCHVYARSSGPDASRGVSAVKWLIFDEAAFIDDGPEVYGAAKMTTASGGHTIMISTPNGNDKLYYNTCIQAEKGINGFHITKLRWYQDPRYNKNLKWTRKDKETGEITTIIEETIDKDGRVEYREEEWYELERQGFKATSPWYEEMCKGLNNDPQKISQELDVSFIGSGNNVVEHEIIEEYNKKYVREPLVDPQIEETWVWKDVVEGHRYIMAIDASTGSGEDSAVIEILDIDAIDEDGVPRIEQVLEYQGKVPQDVLADYANKYGRLYGDALCVVDCLGGYGDAVIIRLQQLGYPNLFYDDSSLKTPTVINDGDINESQKNEKQAGFRIKSARFIMLKDFELALREKSITIRSKRVTAELETWIWKGKGNTIRQDHQSGYHDDTLTSIAMGMYIAKYHLAKLLKAQKKDIEIIKNWIVASKITSDSPKKEIKKMNIGFIRSSNGSNTKEDIRKMNPNNPFALEKVYSSNKGLFKRY